MFLVLPGSLQIERESLKGRDVVLSRRFVLRWKYFKKRVHVEGAFKGFSFKVRKYMLGFRVGFFHFTKGKLTKDKIRALRDQKKKKKPADGKKKLRKGQLKKLAKKLEKKNKKLEKKKRSIKRVKLKGRRVRLKRKSVFFKMKRLVSIYGIKKGKRRRKKKQKRLMLGLRG